MLPNAPTLGEPQPNFFITSRVIGIPTLAHKDPGNPPNCVLDGFITKAPPPCPKTVRYVLLVFICQ